MLSRHETGASAMLVAGALLLMMGMAAIAVDVGAAFNERRDNQTSADVGVLAGAIDLTSLGVCGGTGSQDGGCNQALDVVRLNIKEQFTGPVTTDAAYADVWRTCTDTDKPNGFVPLPTTGVAPWNGFTGTDDDGNAFTDRIDCISASQTELRVKIPDQLTDTSFGRVLGIAEISTNAAAQAGISFSGGQGPMIPFGVTAGTAGHDCLLEPPTGFADPPCIGGTTGNYGAILSQTWGSDVSIAECGNSDWPPDGEDLTHNIAAGMDHPIAVVDLPFPPGFPTTATSFDQDVNTGDAMVDEETVLDRCKLDGGEVVGWDQDNGTAADAGPVNTLRVDTGGNFSSPTLKGFITGTAGDFPKSTAPSLEARIRYSEDCGAGPIPAERLCITIDGEDYLVDDVPIWEHLVTGFDITLYNDSMGNSCDMDPDTFVTNSEEMDCVLKSPDLSTVIFEDTIADSLRFSWVPEFYYADWATGIQWQPVQAFKVAYIHAFWFNIPAGTQRWAPMGAAQDTLNVPITNPNALITVTAFVVPDGALSNTVLSGCPTCSNANLDVVLTR